MSCKKYIYITRHGKTLFNEKELTQGWCDSPLTENGKQVALNLGKGLKKHNLEFDAIYTSPFIRALDTTKLILEGMEKQQTFIIDDRLKEMNFGVWEGESNHLRFRVLGQHAFNEDYGYAEGETHQGVFKRTMDFLEDIAENQSGDKILVVTHGVWIMNYLSRTTDWKPSYENGGIQNASVTLLVYEDGKFSVEKIGDLSYSEDEKSYNA